MLHRSNMSTWANSINAEVAKLPEVVTFHEHPFWGTIPQFRVSVERDHDTRRGMLGCHTLAKDIALTSNANGLRDMEMCFVRFADETEPHVRILERQSNGLYSVTL